MNRKVLLTVFIALFTAIISIGGLFKIPLGPVPIVLQNALCILTGIIMGGYLAGLPTLIFILAGLIGLPVYSGGTSGIAVLLGPTGGFFPGYLIGAVLAGFIAGKPSVTEKKDRVKTLIRVTAAMIAGMVILYVPGVIRFSYWALGAGKVPAEKTVLAYTMGACVLPFIPGDIIKMIICIPVALTVRPLFAQYFFSSSGENGDENKKA